MNNTKSIFCMVLVFSFIFSLGAYSSEVKAWGQTGHRITGKIAEIYLTPEAKASISLILENESLAEISTYADENRSNPAHFWQKVAGPFHYVTVPKGNTYKEVGAPAQGDAYTAIKMYSKTLKDALTSRKEKQHALKMLVHIIGDLHQPLHAGNGNDRGGNDRKVKFFWTDSNLHRVWDSGMIDRMQLSYTEWTEFLATKISPEMEQAWATNNPLIYIKESTEIRDTVYPKEDELSWQYQYEHMPTVKLRLQQAGVRIAAHLNEIFK